MKFKNKHCYGFTLVELAAVLAVISMLGGLLLPSLSKISSNAKSLRCLNNGKQLAYALKLYAADNQGFMPPNPDDGNTAAGHNWMAGNIGAETVATNHAALTNYSLNMLAPYVGGQYTIFKCPADAYVRPGKRHITVRSVSLSQAVGTVCQAYYNGAGHSGVPNLPVNGPWLDNAHSHRSGNPYRTFGNVSHFVDPQNTWVFVDEDYRSINDGGFGMGVAVAEWIDFPSTDHQFGAGFVFADGHSEIHKWSDSRTKISGSLTRRSVPGSKDWAWMASKTTSRAR